MEAKRKFNDSLAAVQKYLYFSRYKKYNPSEKMISLVLAKNEVTKQSKCQGMVSLPGVCPGDPFSTLFMEV
jgi:hypothetical protein